MNEVEEALNENVGQGTAEPENKAEEAPAAESEKKEEPAPAAEPETGRRRRSMPAAEPETKQEQAPAQEPETPHVATPVAGETILAPMPGNILDVRVSIGQTVKAGDVLMILEAMKMENEIICPRDGVVTSIPAIENAVVDTGMVLITLD